MDTRNKPSLSEILKQFAESHTKTANEEVPPVVDPTMCVDGDVPAEEVPAPVEGADEITTSDDVAAAAEAVEDAEAATVDAKATLQAVADDFINEHTAALKKEAQVFGELFAASVMDQFNKYAALQEVEDCSYQYSSEILDAAELQQKVAAVQEQAYVVTMAKLAGFDSPEEMQAAAGIDHALSPEEAAELAQYIQEADGTQEYSGVTDEQEALADEEELQAPGELSDEEVAALENQLITESYDSTMAALTEALEETSEAAEANAEAIGNIAKAVQALIPANATDTEGTAQDSENAVDAECTGDECSLEDIQRQAYENTMAQLGE